MRGAVNNFRFNESPVDLLGRVTEVGRTEPTLPREWSDYFRRTAMPPVRVPGLQHVDGQPGVLISVGPRFPSRPPGRRRLRTCSPDAGGQSPPVAGLIAAAGVALLVLGTITADEQAGQPTARSPRSIVIDREPKSILIDHELEEVFRPRDRPPAGAFTRIRAWHALFGRHWRAHRQMPAGTSARYGVLTWNGLGGINTRQVWRFSSGPFFCTMEFPPSPPPRCLDWDFVDAFDGTDVLYSEQRLPSGRR